MAPKVGPSVNVPTTDPMWQEQRLVDGKDMTPQEAKINKQQTQAMTDVFETMQKPVQKGDTKGARARAAEVEKQFNNLSPDNKKYVYGKLQTDNGLAEEFKYRFSTATRDKLLKTLNPDHKEENITKYTVPDAKEKAQKAVSGMSYQQEQLKNDLLNGLYNVWAEQTQKDLERKMEDID